MRELMVRDMPRALIVAGEADTAAAGELARLLSPWSIEITSQVVESGATADANKIASLIRDTDVVLAIVSNTSAEAVKPLLLVSRDAGKPRLVFLAGLVFAELEATGGWAYTLAGSVPKTIPSAGVASLEAAIRNGLHALGLLPPPAAPSQHDGGESPPTRRDSIFNRVAAVAMILLLLGFALCTSFSRP